MLHEFCHSFCFTFEISIIKIYEIIFILISILIFTVLIFMLLCAFRTVDFKNMVFKGKGRILIKLIIILCTQISFSFDMIFFNYFIQIGYPQLYFFKIIKIIDPILILSDLYKLLKISQYKSIKIKFENSVNIKVSFVNLILGIFIVIRVVFPRIELSIFFIIVPWIFINKT